MDPILENESQGSSTDYPVETGKSRHKHKKKKDQNLQSQSGSQTVVGERRKFLVTKLSVTEEKDEQPSTSTTCNNAHTIHFGTRGAEPQRPHARTIFKEQSSETPRASSAEREPVKKEYETFHGTSSSQRTSIFDIFRLRRKSDAKKHQSLMQNMKAALGGTSKNVDIPEIHKDSHKLDEPKSADKKYYHTVTGASSRKYSPITKVMDIFRSKPQSETPASSDAGKKKNAKQTRRSSIGTTSPTYHKNSYASLDPLQVKQLFREVRGLPKYDPYLSIVQISLGGRDKTRLLLNFFKYHKCYEILPKSAKVIIFDTQFLVRKTFPTLISHGIRSAPLWDANKKELIGMVTVTDFIRILLHLFDANVAMDELECHNLNTWRKLLRHNRKPLCWVGPDQSLHDAINLLTKNRVHRLLVVDASTGDVLYILSHKRILRFLFVYLNEFPELTFFHKTLTELKIGTYNEIASVTDNTSLKETFQVLLDKNISALPVLDENGKLLDVYAKYEVMNLVAEKLYFNLLLTVGDVRNRKKDWEEKLQKCRSSITLYEALDIIVRTESHRLLLVNRDDNLIGIVSLSDILIYLNRIIPCEKKVTSLQEIFRPLEENKEAEALKDADNVIVQPPKTNMENDAQKKESKNPTEIMKPEIKVSYVDEIISQCDNDMSAKSNRESVTKLSDAVNDEDKHDSLESKASVSNDTPKQILVDEIKVANSNSKENVIDETSESIMIA